MKGNPDVPGGSLTSKPTWWNISGCFTTSAFLFLALRRVPIRPHQNQARVAPHSLAAWKITYTVLDQGHTASDLEKAYKDAQAAARAAAVLIAE